MAFVPTVWSTKGLFLASFLPWKCVELITRKTSLKLGTIYRKEVLRTNSV